MAIDDDDYEYEAFECIVCGRTEDEIPVDETETSGTIYPTNSGEITAPETFVCGRCLDRIRS